LQVLPTPADYPGLSLILTIIEANSRDPALGTKVITAILVMLMQIACQSEGDEEVAAWLGTERLNREIKLSLVEYDPVRVRLNSPVPLLLENRSKEQFVFGLDFSARLFVYSESNEEWHEIENGSHYPSVGWPIILAPSGEKPSDSTYMSVLPRAEPSPDFTLLRIVVVGREWIPRQWEPRAGESVGAYIDLELNH